MFQQSIPCEGFAATASYDGYAFGDTYYRVSVVVRDLAEANASVDAIRKAIAADPERKHWEENAHATPRLVSSNWSGNPVSVVLQYTATDRES